MNFNVNLVKPIAPAVKHSFMDKKLDKSEQIKLLRSEHANAIENFDFDHAESIANQIERLQAELERDKQSGVRRLDIDEQREIFLNTQTQLESEHLTKRTELQRRFHKRYQEMQERQAHEFTELAAAEAEALARERSRKAPEVKSLEMLAKLKGKEHDYASARAIYQEAVDLHRDIVDRRLCTVKMDFEKQRRKLSEKHEWELKLLAEKRDRAMREIDQKHMREDEKLSKHMKVTEIREKQEKTPRSVRMRAVSPLLAKRRRSASVSRNQSQATTPREKSWRSWSRSRARDY